MHLAFILDERFFAILDECYLDILEPMREAFGCDFKDVVFEEYVKAYETYVEAVLEKMEIWVADRKAQLEVEGQAKEKDVKTVLDELINKLTYLLNHFWLSVGHRIYFQTGAPIASIAWIKDLNAILKSEETWISMVSLATPDN